MLLHELVPAVQGDEDGRLRALRCHSADILDGAPPIDLGPEVVDERGQGAGVAPGHARPDVREHRQVRQGRRRVDEVHMQVPRVQGRDGLQDEAAHRRGPAAARRTGQEPGAVTRVPAKSAHALGVRLVDEPDRDNATGRDGDGSCCLPRLTGRAVVPQGREGGQ